MGDPFGWAGQDRHEQTGGDDTRTPGRRLGVGTARLPGVHFMIGNDTPTRPNQIPLPTTSPEFQDAHYDQPYFRGRSGYADGSQGPDRFVGWGSFPWCLLAVLATLPLVTSRPRRARGTERGARPAAHVRTWSRVAIVVAVIGAIATLAAAIGALVKVDGGSTPAPARLAISRIVLPAPGATPKIIRVAGTGTAGQRIRCFAKPVDGGPVEGATPTSSAVRPTLGGAPDPAGTGAPRRPAEYWYVSDLALADRTGAWQATVAVDADQHRTLDIQAAVEARTPAAGPEGPRLIGPGSGTEVTPPTRVTLP